MPSSFPSVCFPLTCVSVSLSVLLKGCRDVRLRRQRAEAGRLHPASAVHWLWVLMPTRTPPTRTKHFIMNHDSLITALKHQIISGSENNLYKHLRSPQPICLWVHIYSYWKKSAIIGWNCRHPPVMDVVSKVIWFCYIQ